MQQASFRTFLVVWIGQMVSVVGSGLTGFGLGVWVFQRTGSATQYAMIGLAAIVPTIVLSPFAGAFVDRWDRRLTMIGADLVAGISTLAVALLLWSGQLEIWHILVTTSVAACAGAFQRPAYMAAITQMVPKEQLGKAAGLAQLAEPLSTIMAPVIAGLLIVPIGLSGIITIDFVTFLFAVGALLVVRFPLAEKPESSEAPHMAREIREGWEFVAERKGLLHLMLYFLVINFVFGFVGVLYAPLVLSFAGAAGLGTVMALAGVGGLAGGIAMGAWGGPKKRAPAVLVLGVLLGVFVAATGLRASVPLIAACAFLTMVVLAIDSAVSQVLWQVKTPQHVQGRVFALRNMFAMLAMPVSYLLAGPLADKVFEPAMVAGGVWADMFGPLVGVGEGRGFALLCVFGGLLAAVVSALAFVSSRLRNLDAELPDAV